jgi:hypothetical protein
MATAALLLLLSRGSSPCQPCRLCCPVPHPVRLPPPLPSLTTLSISSVVMPGRTTAAAASSTSRPTLQARRMPATSSGLRVATAAAAAAGSTPDSQHMGCVR